MNTESFQQLLARSIGGESGLFNRENIIGPAPVDQLIQVYQNNYRLSLTEYLQAVFPAVEQLVGHDFFVLLAREYIKEHPPREPQLDGYGKHLPLFIEQFSAADAVPYLADVARLEWQLDRLGNQRYQIAPPFPITELQALDPEEQSQIGFTLSNNLRWLDFSHPALGIWQAIEREDFDGIHLEQQESVLFHLQPDHSIAMESISPSAGLLLAAFEKGEPLHQVMTNNSLACAVDQYLNTWITQGVITGFTKPRGNNHE